MQKSKFTRFYTSQIDEKDCGIAALNMILKFYNSNYNLAHLRQLARTSRNGTTALGIVKAAQKLGFETLAIKTDISVFKRDNVSYPCIVHIIKKNNLTHYYTIFGISNNKLIIGDPNPNKAIEYMDLNTFQKEWSGIVIFLNPTDKYRIKVEKKNTLFQFIPIILSQIKLICLTILAAIIVTAISILGSYFVQHIVDDYIPNAKNSVMTIIAISLLFAYIIQAIMSFIQQYLSAKFGQRLKNIISFNYLKHVFKLPLSFFYTRKIGEITSRLNDANNVIDTLASAILSVFLDIWIVLIVSIFLVIQNFQLFLMTMLIMPIYTLIIYIFNKPFQKINHEMMENDSKLGSTVIEGLNGIETVKSLNSEGKLLDRIKKELSNYLNSDLKYKRMDFLQQSLKRGLKQILSLLILWVGAIFVIRHNLSLGELFTFNILLTFFLNPLESIVNL